MSPPATKPVISQVVITPTFATTNTIIAVSCKITQMTELNNIASVVIGNVDIDETRTYALERDVDDATIFRAFIEAQPCVSFWTAIVACNSLGTRVTGADYITVVPYETGYVLFEAAEDVSSWEHENIDISSSGIFSDVSFKRTNGRSYFYHEVGALHQGMFFKFLGEIKITPGFQLMTPLYGLINKDVTNLAHRVGVALRNDISNVYAKILIADSTETEHESAEIVLEYDEIYQFELSYNPDTRKFTLNITSDDDVVTEELILPEDREFEVNGIGGLLIDTVDTPLDMVNWLIKDIALQVGISREAFPEVNINVELG